MNRFKIILAIFGVLFFASACDAGSGLIKKEIIPSADSAEGDTQEPPNVAQNNLPANTPRFTPAPRPPRQVTPFTGGNINGTLQSPQLRRPIVLATPQTQNPTPLVSGNFVRPQPSLSTLVAALPQIELQAAHKSLAQYYQIDASVVADKWNTIIGSNVLPSDIQNDPENFAKFIKFLKEVEPEIITMIQSSKNTFSQAKIMLQNARDLVANSDKIKKETLKDLNLDLSFFNEQLIDSTEVMKELREKVIFDSKFYGIDLSSENVRERFKVIQSDDFFAKKVLRDFSKDLELASVAQFGPGAQVSPTDLLEQELGGFYQQNQTLIRTQTRIASSLLIRLLEATTFTVQNNDISFYDFNQNDFGPVSLIKVGF